MRPSLVALDETIRRIGHALGVQSVYQPLPGDMPDWPDWRLGNPAWMNEQELQHKDAFKKVPIIHALVSLIQHDAASLPRRFYDGDNPDPMEREFGNVVDVWEGANPRDTGHEFRVELFGDLELNDAFVFLERGKNAPPTRPPYRIWTLKPHLVTPVPGKDRTMEDYLWNPGSGPQSIKPWNVIHIRGFNSDDDVRGTSWLEPAREDWIAMLYALKVMRAFFMKGGLSPGTWSTKAGTKPPNEEDIKRMQRRYGSRFQSSDINRLWSLIVMEGLEQIEKGHTISDLMLDRMLTIMKVNACNCARVPAWKVGVQELGVLNASKSSEVSDEGYWRSTIGDRVRLVDAVMNERFCPLFDGGTRRITVETDMDGVPALQAARLELMKSAAIAAGGPVVSVNETRRWIGEDPRPEPEHDVIREKVSPFEPAGGGLPAAHPRPLPPSPEPRPVSRVLKLAHSRKTRERMRRREDKLLRREERKMQRLWEGVFEEQRAYAHERLREAQERDEGTVDAMVPRGLSRPRFVPITIDPDALFSGITDEQRARIRKQVEEIMEDASEQAASEIGVEVAIDIASAKVEAYVTGRVGTMILHTSDTTRALLRERVGASSTYAEAIEAVNSVFDQRRENALTIARTETVGPYNQSRRDTWSDGGVRRKYWQDMQDEAVRKTHEKAAEDFGPDSSIPMDEPFYVGGYATDVPGNTGEPSEDINCRCVVMPDLEDFDAEVEAARRSTSGWLARILRRAGKTAVHAGGNGDG